MGSADPAQTPTEEDGQVEPQAVEKSAGPPETQEAETSQEPRRRKREKKKRPRDMVIPEERLHELEEKSKKADEYYAHYVQARADLDNLRKRIQREKESFVRYANEQLLSEIVPVLDNFERAFTAAEKVPATHNFAVGVEMILKQLRDVLGRYGVKELHPLGEPFDPARHEAADRIETTEHPDGTVLEVLQRGCVLNGRVVQPAVVKVAVNPEARVEREPEPAPATAGDEATPADSPNPPAERAEPQPAPGESEETREDS